MVEKLNEQPKQENISLDVTSLFEGQEFRNYGALCDELKLPKFKTGSNQYKSQMKMLSQYCEWHKSGHKILIDKVFTQKQSKKVQVRQTTASLIKLGVEYNLLNIMLQSVTEDDVRIINNGEENEQEMLHCNYFTIPTLHKATGLVNDFYYIARHNQEVISELENIEQEIIRDFFNMTHKKLNWIIKESLDQLHKKRLITYHKGKKLTFVRWEYNDNKLKENGKVKGKCTYFSSFATKDQLALIEKCEREAMKKFNLSHFNYIYGRSSNERKKFFRSVEKRIRNYAINSNNEEIKPLAKLNKYANAYEIYITPKWIMEEANKLEYKIQLAKDDYMKAREDYINVLKSMSEYQLVQTHYDVRQVVNENVIKSLVRNSVARHKKADVESIRAKESYVNSCNKLIENYIQRKNDYKTVRNSLIDRGLIKDSHDMDYNKENVEISLNIQDIA